MPQHPHNDRTQQRLLPWIALIGFLGVALYALLPADFWLPEYKSAHHTVTPREALTADDFADDDYEDEPAAPPPTQPPAPPPKEIPGPPTSAKPPAKTTGQWPLHQTLPNLAAFRRLLVPPAKKRLQPDPGRPA